MSCSIINYFSWIFSVPRPKNPIFDTNPALNIKNSSGSLTLDNFGLWFVPFLVVPIYRNSFSASKPDNKTVRIRSSVGNLGAQNVVVDVTAKALRIVVRRFDSEAVCITWDGFDWSNRNFSLKPIPPKSVDIVFANEKALEEVRILSNKVTKYEGKQIFKIILKFK